MRVGSLVLQLLCLLEMTLLYAYIWLLQLYSPALTAWPGIGIYCGAVILRIFWLSRSELERSMLGSARARTIRMGCVTIKALDYALTVATAAQHWGEWGADNGSAVFACLGLAKAVRLVYEEVVLDVCANGRTLLVLSVIDVASGGVFLGVRRFTEKRLLLPSALPTSLLISAVIPIGGWLVASWWEVSQLDLSRQAGTLVRRTISSTRAITATASSLHSELDMRLRSGASKSIEATRTRSAPGAINAWES